LTDPKTREVRVGSRGLERSDNKINIPSINITNNHLLVASLLGRPASPALRQVASPRVYPPPPPVPLSAPKPV